MKLIKKFKRAYKVFINDKILLYEGLNSIVVDEKRLRTLRYSIICDNENSFNSQHYIKLDEAKINFMYSVMDFVKVEKTNYDQKHDRYTLSIDIIE